MSEASKALQKIAKGTGIVFFGTLISMFFQFLSRALIARYFSTAEYGVFNLALTVLSIALVIATLGFSNALPREIAFYKEKEPGRVKSLISTALIIATLNSLVWTMILILGAGGIAQIFDEERLVYTLKVVAFSLPFWTLTGTMISISRGFGRVREQVYFQNIVYPTAFFIMVVVIVLFDASFTYVFSAYVTSQIIMFLSLILNVLKIKLFEFGGSLDLKLGGELVKFSIPLLFAGILSFAMTWADTLMLGYYKSSEVVGIYNAASPMAKLLPIFLNSASFLYVPVASQLYAQGKLREMGRVYQVLTKWVFLLTLPAFAIMFLFPEATINFFFGAKYLEASKALQILAVGFMFHTFLGLNGLSLIVIGSTGANFMCDLLATIANVILNLILIPKYGMEGAAMATSISYVVANVFRSFWLYQKTKIHPFSWNYVKPLTISFVLLGLIRSFHLRVLNIGHAVLILAVLLEVYFGLVLLSKSIDKEDIDLVLAIEKKMGINLGLLKRMLKRFV